MELRHTMRHYYDKWDKKREKKISGLKQAKKFSYENIGNHLNRFFEVG